MHKSAGMGVFLPLGPRTLPQGATPTSFLDHAAALHGLTREAVVRAAAGPSFESAGNRGKDWDFDLPARCARILEVAARLPAGSIRCVAAEERHWALDVDARGQFCPLCFEEELRCNRLPHFQALWGRASLTHCPIHRAPLMLFGGGHGVKGGRYFPERWLNWVVGLNMDPSERRSRRERPPSSWRAGKASTVFGVDQTGFEWLEWGRLVTQTFGADAITPSPRLAAALQEWNAYLEFETELNGFKPVECSVLAKLEPGDHRGFIADLYSLLTTRFSLLGDLAIEHSFANDVEGPARVLLWGRWNRHISLVPQFFEGGQGDWRKERHVEVRRTALRQIMLDLEEILSCDTTNGRRDPDHAERLVELLVRQKRCATLNVIAELDDEAYDWIAAAQKTWPAPIPRLLSKVLSTVPRGRRNPLRQREQTEIRSRMVADIERRFLVQHRVEIDALVSGAKGGDAARAKPSSRGSGSTHR